MLAATSGDALTVIAPLLTLAAGLGGVILGAALQGRTAREQWLRDRRLDTYTSLSAAFLRLVMLAKRSTSSSAQVRLVYQTLGEDKRFRNDPLSALIDPPPILQVDDRDLQRAISEAQAAAEEFQRACAEFDALVMRVRAIGSSKAVEAADTLDRFVHDNITEAGSPAEALFEGTADLSTAFIAAIRAEI